MPSFYFPFSIFSKSGWGVMHPAPPCLLRPPVSAPGCANLARDSDRGYEVVVPRLSFPFHFLFDLELARHPCLSAAKHGIELDPGHIGFGDVGPMAASTFARRGFFSGLGVWQGMMPEIKEPPAVGLRKPLTVFHRYVETVELAVEISPAGRFRPRAVRKPRIKNACQLLDDDGSFGKRTRRQIHIQIFFFYVYVMIFGKSRFPVVKTIRC